MATAYLDESGIHQDSPAVVIAGYFAVLEAWERFEISWNEALRQAGLSTFHATDCLGGYGLFKDMSDRQCNDLYKHMIQIIGAHQITGVSSGLFTREYDAVMSDLPKAALLKPYVFCFQHVMFDLYGSFVKAYPDDHEKLAVVCGTQRDFGHGALDLFLNLKEHTNGYFARLGTITFAADNGAPLQAADLLAHETYRELNRRVDDVSHRPERLSFRELSRSGLEGHYLDQQSLLALKQHFFTNPDWWRVEGHGSV